MVSVTSLRMTAASAPAAQRPAKPGLGVGKPCSTTLDAMDSQGGAADRGASRRTAFLRLGAYGRCSQRCSRSSHSPGSFPSADEARDWATTSARSPTSPTCRCS